MESNGSHLPSVSLPKLKVIGLGLHYLLAKTETTALGDMTGDSNAYLKLWVFFYR